MNVQEVPESDMEVCYYSIAAKDPNSTMGDGLRKCKSICISCFGKRADCVRVDCWSYTASNKGHTDYIIRKKGLGFVLIGDLHKPDEEKGLAGILE